MTVFYDNQASDRAQEPQSEEPNSIGAKLLRLLIYALIVAYLSVLGFEAFNVFTNPPYQDCCPPSSLPFGGPVS